MPNRSSVHKRHSIYNRNPGSRRGTEGVIEKQIAGKWHVITFEEAIDYVGHDLLTIRFHVTRYSGCAILFNKDTVHTKVDVKSIYLHDTRRELPNQVMEEEKEWILQGVLSRAIFQRQPEILYWFHVSRYGGCTVLLTRTPSTQILKLNLFAFMIPRRELLDKVMEWERGWVLQGVLPRCFFSQTTPQRPEKTQVCPAY